jgi:transposase
MNDKYIYALYRPSNGALFYIGRGAGRRVHQHESFARSGTHVNKHVENIIKKEGGTVIKKKLFENMSLAEVCQKEEELIAFYGRTIDKEHPGGILANIEPGGIAAEISPETREKMSKSAKTRIRDTLSYVKGVATRTAQFSGRNDKIIELYREYENVEKVCAELGLTLDLVRHVLSKNKEGTEARERRNAEAERLYDLGTPRREIAETVGLSVSQVEIITRKYRERKLAAQGLVKPEPVDYTARNKQILDLIESGLSQVKVAKKLGISPYVVMHTVQRFGQKLAA